MESILSLLGLTEAPRIRFRLNYAGSCVVVRSNHLLPIQRLLDYFDSFQDTLGSDTEPDQTIYAVHSVEWFERLRSLMQTLPCQETADRLHLTAEHAGARLICSKVKPVGYAISAVGAVMLGNIVEHTSDLVSLISRRLSVHWKNQGYELMSGAAVERGGLVTLLLGNEGEGAEAALLHLLEQGYQFMSARALALRRTNGDIEVIGSPTFPRVSIGTLMDHPRFRMMMNTEEQTSYLSLPRAQLYSMEKAREVFLDKFYRTGKSTPRGILHRLLWLDLDWQGGRLYEVRQIPVDEFSMMGPQLALDGGMFVYPLATREEPTSSWLAQLPQRADAYQIRGDLDQRVMRRAFREVGLLDD